MAPNIACMAAACLSIRCNRSPASTERGRVESSTQVRSSSLAEDRIAVRKTSPGVLLARFRRDARLEIGELRREERASLRARRAVIDRRRIGLCVHRVKSPQSRAGKRDHANRGPSGRRGQERHDKLRFRHRCPPGLVARCCPRMSLLLQSTTKRASDRGLKYSVTNSSCARSLTSDRLRQKLFSSERVLEHGVHVPRPGC